MVISFHETYPVTEEFFLKSVKDKYYAKNISVLHGKIPADVLISDEKYLFIGDNFQKTLIFAPSDSKISDSANRKNIFLCGMHLNDAVTFSSIGETSAFICLQKEMEFCGMKILPFESKVNFDRNYGLYKNISVGFIITLLDLYFSEKFDGTNEF